MRIKSLHLVGFRSYIDQTIHFEPAITTIVGENNTGKSTISLAIRYLLMHLASGPPYTPDMDHPYGEVGYLAIKGEFELSDSEKAELTASLLPDTILVNPVDRARILEWLNAQPYALSAISDNLGGVSRASVVFGGLTFAQDAIGATVSRGEVHQIADVLENASLPQQWMQAGLNLPAYIGNAFMKKYKRMEEFRMRSSEQRTQSVESMSGAETASVLLNLKNHFERGERDRYEAIKSAFHELFPRYHIEAVESAPGTNMPVVQFWEEGHRKPLSLAHVSAGVHQVLTFLVNLIGQIDLIVVAEHPEQHLHPHGMRFLQRMMRERSSQNQVVIVTHDPHFVPTDGMSGIRRVWWTTSGRTQVYGVGSQLSLKEIDQVTTALRHLGDREMVFARCVILVEDETQQEFLLAVAPTLGYRLDAHGISVVSVGSEDGYKPFLTALEALRVPVVAIRDKPWGDADRYPAERFFSMGMEIETYLDQQGLATMRMAVMQQRGTSKRRVGGILGSRLDAHEVPSLFGALLERATAMATGEPATQ